MGLEIIQRAEFSCGYMSSMSQLPKFNACHYKVEVTVCSKHKGYDIDLVISYSDMKKYLDKILPNNAFMISTDIDVPEFNILYDTFKRLGVRVAKVDYTITSENLATAIANTLQTIMDDDKLDLVVTEVKLKETNSSTVRWSKRI